MKGAFSESLSKIDDTKLTQNSANNVRRSDPANDAPIDNSISENTKGVSSVAVSP